MTKHLHRIHAALGKQILERGVPLRPPLPPAARDGYAVIAKWIEYGESMHRLTPEQAVSARRGLPPDLQLARDECRGAVAYQLLERDQWIVLARVPARDPVSLQPAVAFAYADPVLVYITALEDWATGCINLRESPTPGKLHIAPGKMYRELYATPLEREDIAPEITRLAMVLPHFYFC